jgi:hypothetical protein
MAMLNLDHVYFQQCDKYMYHEIKLCHDKFMHKSKNAKASEQFGGKKPNKLMKSDNQKNFF